MTKDEMRRRLMRFALAVARFVEALPRGRTAEAAARQLIRCGTSVAANYRAACRAKSPADFISKMGIVEEETDETLFWLEFLVGADIVQQENVADLTREAEEILAMVVASINTARRNLRQSPAP